MKRKNCANVWNAIEERPAAENMKPRSALMTALKDRIKSEGWSHAEATRRLGVTQPRISDLVRGRIDLFDLDTLVNLATAAGLQVKMRISREGGG